MKDEGRKDEEKTEEARLPSAFILAFPAAARLKNSSSQEFYSDLRFSEVSLKVRQGEKRG